MAESNLIPSNKRSLEEVRENGRRGGIKSGQSRRAKKTLSERIKLALTISTNENLKALKRQIKEHWKNRRNGISIDGTSAKESIKMLIAQAKTIRDCGVDVYQILKIAQAPETQEIALKATNALWDREEGKAMQLNKTEVTGKDGESISMTYELAPATELNIRKQKEEREKLD